MIKWCVENCNFTDHRSRYWNVNAKYWNTVFYSPVSSRVNDRSANKLIFKVLLGSRLNPSVFLYKKFWFLGEISSTFSSESMEYTDILETVSIYLKRESYIISLRIIVLYRDISREWANVNTYLITWLSSSNFLRVFCKWLHTWWI